MVRKSETLEVRVSHRVLWIGAAAYPLQNIARAQIIELVPDRARAVSRFVGQVILSVLLGAALIAGTNILGGSLSDADFPRLLAVIVVFVLIALSTIKLVTRLMTRTYYGMVIETAGSPQTALVSTSRQEVSAIVRQTMDAIDNPRAEFHYQVQHLTSIGEQYNVSGTHNTGKRVAA
jgi:hypothetical protein